VTPRLDEAIARWTEALGTRIFGPSVARYQRNLTLYPVRELPTVLLPRTTEDVQTLVRIAADCGVPLHPVSTGGNWGLGSKMPVRSGAVVVDLSGMARIRRVDATHKVAVVEPGVTQAQLADRLDGLPLQVNVTGSAASTSVLGNALERGVGVSGPRHREIRALEVVLPDGQLLRTGAWHFAADPTTAPHHHAEGVGPDLTGLFLQSSLGIVTAMAVSLRPVQGTSLVLATCTESQLPALVDAVAGLRAEGLVEDRVELDVQDDPRVTSLVTPTTERMWVLWATVRGPDRVRLAILDEIDDRLEPLTTSLRTLEEDDADDEATRVRFALCAGQPSDYSMRTMAEAFGATAPPGTDLDDIPSFPGFVVALPAVPTLGSEVRRCLDVFAALERDLGVHTIVSFSTIGPSTFETFSRVVFDRDDPASAARAHTWAQRVHEALLAAGFHPLRTNIEQMRWLCDDTDSTFWQTVGHLKRALDPAGIVSPGRYTP
jgi:4-cresol dehydrogenase (hydroxylating)